MFQKLLTSISLPFFGAAMVFGALANGLFFLVLNRMSSIGHRVGVWRTHRDWVLYREYWRVAPQRNWSRAPILMGILSFILAALFMWLSVTGAHVPH